MPCAAAGEPMPCGMARPLVPLGRSFGQREVISSLGAAGAADDAAGGGTATGGTTDAGSWAAAGNDKARRTRASPKQREDTRRNAYTQTTTLSCCPLLPPIHCQLIAAIVRILHLPFAVRP